MSASTITRLDGLAGRVPPTAVRPARQDGLGETLDELCTRLGPLCANAVDSLEVAAGLESDGMSDQLARVRYGYPDVFALAEAMYRATVRRPAEPTPRPSAWRSPVGRHLLHGLLFGLPALCYPVAASAMGSRGALIVLVVSMLTAWPVSQAVSHLGHVRRSRLDVDGSRRLLRAALPIAFGFLVAVTLPTALLLGQSWPVLWFALGQGGYLLGATVLLVCGADWWLAAALAPGVIGSALYLLAGRPTWSHPLAWGAIGASLVLTLGFALLRTSWPRPARSARPIRMVELLAGGPSGVFGLLVAGLLLFPLVAARFTHGGQGVGAASLLATLPLSLSMGIAEWRLYGYRGRIEKLMRHAVALPRFGRRTTLVLVGVLGEYLLGAAVLLVGVVSLAELANIHPQWTDLPAYLGCLVLGGALFVALLIQVCVGPVQILGWCAAALAAEIALAIFAPHLALPQVQLVVTAAMAFALLCHAAATLARASRHAI
jgi:hypothetical protein